MNPVGATFILAGSIIAFLAGIGLLRFSTPYARFHSAGKASPVAFVLIAVGAATEVGWEGALLLLVAVGAMVLTLPIGVHLLFRATHRTTEGDHLGVDDLKGAEMAAERAERERNRRRHASK